MCLVNNLDVNGLSENDSQDTLAYDDDTHIHIKLFYVLLVSMF